MIRVVGSEYEYRVVHAVGGVGRFRVDSVALVDAVEYADSGNAGIAVFGQIFPTAQSVVETAYFVRLEVGVALVHDIAVGVDGKVLRVVLAVEHGRAVFVGVVISVVPVGIEEGMRIGHIDRRYFVLEIIGGVLIRGDMVEERIAVRYRTCGVLLAGAVLVFVRVAELQTYGYRRIRHGGRFDIESILDPAVI